MKIQECDSERRFSITDLTKQELQIIERALRKHDAPADLKDADAVLACAVHDVMDDLVIPTLA